MIEDFLEHFGVKGMRWGTRKRRNESARARFFGGRKQRKAANAKAAQEFRNTVIDSIGSRDPNELFAVRQNKRSGIAQVMTGKEFVDKANLGMPFHSVQSTGLKIAPRR